MRTSDKALNFVNFNLSFALMQKLFECNEVRAGSGSDRMNVVIHPVAAAPGSDSLSTRTLTLKLL